MKKNWLNKQEKLISRKIRSNVFSQVLIFLFSLVGVFALFLMFGLILQRSTLAYREFGIWDIYFGVDFNPESSTNPTAGIWNGMIITIFTSIFAVIIATPLSIRAAIFLKYRVKYGKRFFRILINILAGIPSVVFGVFAIKSLNSVSGIFSRVDSSLTIANATFMLSIMILPTLISLISNQLDSIDKNLLPSTMSLGSTKTSSIYQVLKKSIRPGIFVAIIVSLGRAIGETMAISMVLGAYGSGNPFSQGFLGFLGSSSKTLGSIIAGSMFTDSTDPIIQSAAFAVGIALFIIVLLLVLIIFSISKRKVFSIQKPKFFLENNTSYVKKIINYLKFPFAYLRYIFHIFTRFIKLIFNWVFYIISFPINYFLTPSKKSQESYSSFYIASSKYKLRNAKDILRIILEVISIVIVLSAIFWIVLDIFIIGIPNIEQKDFNFRKNGIANSLIWTFLLILFTILIAIPFAMGTALYLSEYAKDSKRGNTIRVFLDSLGGTPSILFGIFGMILFLDILQLRNTLGAGSLLAGSLTMFLVVLPTFTRAIEQAFVAVPNSLRQASYALGASKFETIRKVIIPNSLQGIFTGIVLSMGRVVSETAPVFLTLGMSFNIYFGLLNHGQTLTTWILNNQVHGTDSEAVRIANSYKFSSAAIFLVTFITLLAEFSNELSKYIVKPTHFFMRKYFYKPIYKMFKRKGAKNYAIKK